jgi:hypothetical protein
VELLHADEYIACVTSGKKPRLTVVGSMLVTDGMVTGTGKYLLVIDGMLYEVKPDFVVYAEWEQSKPDPGNSKD